MCATRRWLSKRKNTSAQLSAPYFFDFPGLTSVLDLDPGFGCFSSRRVERTYIYLPGLPKKPGCHKPPFAGLGPPAGSPVSHGAQKFPTQRGYAIGFFEVAALSIGIKKTRRACPFYTSAPVPVARTATPPPPTPFEAGHS